MIYTQKSKGAVALLTVIIVTAAALIFVVSLAITNVDYSLTTGTHLLERTLDSALDACVDQAIGALKVDGTLESLTVDDIGPSTIDCVVSISALGDRRHILASATSSGGFYNAGKQASTTIDLSTNPISIIAYESVADTNVSTLISDSYATTNLSFSHNAMAIDGNYGYLIFANSSNSFTTSVARVDLKTMTVDTTLNSITSANSRWYDATVYNGYLYFSYTYSNSGYKVSIARIDLNDFTTDGVEIIENPIGVNNWDGYNTSIVALGDYLYVSYHNNGNSNRTGVMRVDVNNFTSSGITVRENINFSACYYVDNAVYNQYVVVACRAGDFGSDPTIFMIDTTNFSTGEIKTARYDLGAYSGNMPALEIVDNYAYMAYHHSGGNFHVMKINLDTLQGEADLDTGYKRGWYADVTASGPYLYVMYVNSNYMQNIARFDLRDFSLDARLTTTTANGLVYKTNVAIGGNYLYYSGPQPAANPFALKRVLLEQ